VDAAVEVVAGLSLKNLRPRVWDSQSPEHVPALTAVMLSFSEFRRRPRVLEQAVTDGLHAVLAVLGPTPRIYLDNGAFACLRRGERPAVAAYRRFVSAVRPHWYPVPADFIPLPTEPRSRQRRLFERTVAVLEAHTYDGFCPVIHPGAWLDQYLNALTNQLALGGLVPQLLNSRGAQRRQTIARLKRVCREFSGRIHAFGIGGIVTLHLAAALGVASADSSGWRQRAARGLVMLRGQGERQAVQLGNWRGRSLTPDDWRDLARCRCPACRQHGPDGLKAEGLPGFANRAVHNLTVLLDEAALIERHRAAGDFADWSRRRLRGHRMAGLVELALEDD
jgi:7-cyano-7-deazaguanine tRNA-ribosyltransferase